MDQDRTEVLRKLLQHQKPELHTPDFNLIVNSIIMKESVFGMSRIMCNATERDGCRMAEKYGALTGTQLQVALDDVQNNHSRQYSSQPAARYLRGLKAVCNALQHSNEACQQARKKYFSFVIKFGVHKVLGKASGNDSAEGNTMGRADVDLHFE